MKKPVIISIINHKGGVGKTTTLLNIASAMSFISQKKEVKTNTKFKTLLIDNDPQGSLSSFFYNIDDQLEDKDTILAIYDEKPNYTKDIILETKIENVDIVCNMFLTNAKESSLINSINGMYRIKNFINNCCLDYDYILIDNSPSFNVFTKNALISTHFCILPTELTRLSTNGIHEIIETIISVKEVNQDIKLLGILINKYEIRNNTHKIYRDKMYKQFGDSILDTEIHSAVVFQHAERMKKTVVQTDKSSRAYKEYVQLATEIMFKTGFNISYNPNKKYEIDNE